MIVFLFLLKTADAVLTSIHNVRFGSKIWKLGIPLYTPVLYIKAGFKGYILCKHVPDASDFMRVVTVLVMCDVLSLQLGVWVRISNLFYNICVLLSYLCTKTLLIRLRTDSS